MCCLLYPQEVIIFFSNFWNGNGGRLHFFNTLRPRQNGRHFADDIFNCISLNENIHILIKISLKFVHKGPINKIPALVQIMAWRRPGDKPLSEPMWVQWSQFFPISRKITLMMTTTSAQMMIRIWMIVNNNYVDNSYKKGNVIITKTLAIIVALVLVVVYISTYSNFKPDARSSLKGFKQW